MLKDLGYACLAIAVGIGVGAACSSANDGNSDSGVVGGTGNTSGGSTSSGGTTSSGGSSGSGASSSGGTTFSGGTSSGGNGGSLVIDAGDLDGGEEDDAACTTVGLQATNAVDIIWVIDNSCSMGDEIDKVRSNLNGQFVPTISGSNIDWQVVMFSRRGAGSQDVCVGEPLAGPNCQDNPPRFTQVNCEVGSSDSLALLKQTFKTAGGTFPNAFACAGGPGWGTHLRYHSTKIFVEVTDDEAEDPFNPGSNPGADFDFWLTDTVDDIAGSQNPPGFFGTQEERKYVFHSIIGADPNNLNQACQSAACSSDPDGGACNSAVEPGLQYQAISNATGGLIRSICEDDWSDIFNTIANGIVDTLSCEYTPVPPEGETLDPDKVNVTYTPGDTGTPEQILQDNNAGCEEGANGWQWNDTQTKIVLCGDACDTVSSDPLAKIDIQFGCATEVVPPPK